MSQAETIHISSTVELTSSDWGELTPETRKQWVDFIKAHDLDPVRIGFPFKIEPTEHGAIMHVFIYALDSNGNKYVVYEGGERHVAGQIEELPVRHPIPELA